MSAGHSVILVVDDNEAGQMLVRAALQLVGLRVGAAGSPDEVLNRLSAQATEMKRKESAARTNWTLLHPSAQGEPSDQPRSSVSR